MELLIPLLVLVADQFLKTGIQHYYPNFVVINPGIAFSLGSVWLILIGIGLLIWLAVQYQWRPRIVWLAIIAAFCSNLIDRLRIGGVIDYLRLYGLHFNLADIIIVGLTCYLLMTTKKTSV